VLNAAFRKPENGESDHNYQGQQHIDRMAE
jgi:hypothetical protein